MVAGTTTKTSCLLKFLPPPRHYMGFKGQKIEPPVKPHNSPFCCTIVPPTSPTHLPHLHRAPNAGGNVACCVPGFGARRAALASDGVTALPWWGWWWDNCVLMAPLKAPKS
eukprot:9270778-Ditylum_brightwellii.AAC.1